MQLFALLALFLAGSEAFNLRNIIKKPDVGFCLDGTENWLTGIILNVTPWPAHIANGETITLDGQLELLQAVEVGSSLKLSLTLETPLGDLPIPCIPVSYLIFMCQLNQFQKYLFSSLVTLALELVHMMLKSFWMILMVLACVGKSCPKAKPVPCP